MKKAFTLIELLAVVLILGIVALVAVPIVTNVQENSRKRAYDEIISNILSSSKNYSVYNQLGYDENYNILTLEELKNSGYLENKTLIDPRDNSNITGCVFYRWVAAKEQYEFVYDDDCDLQNVYVDITKPNVSISTSLKKTDRITVNAICTDSDSEISKYEFSLDDGSTWINNNKNSSYEFLNLVSGRTYTFKVKCTDESGNFDTASKVETIPTVIKPTIVQNSQQLPGFEWAQSRVIKITYSSGNSQNSTYYFKSSVEATVGNNVISASCGSANVPGTCTASNVTSLRPDVWYKTSSTTPLITYSQIGTLYAITKDEGNNKSETATYSVAKIDTTEPIATISVSNVKADRATVSVNCFDAESGTIKYEFNNGTGWISYTSTTSHTYYNLTPGATYIFQARCTNGAGLTETDSEMISTSSISAPVFTQSYKAPQTPIYAFRRDIRIKYDTVGTNDISNYFRSTANTRVESPESPSDGDLLMQCGTGNSPSTCTRFAQEELVAGTWYKVIGQNAIILVYETTADLVAITNVSGNYLTSNYHVDIYENGMTLNPTIASTSANKIVVMANCQDSNYDITNIKYSINNGTSWIDAGTQTAYAFENLTPGNTYTFTVKCKNEVGFALTRSVSGTTSTIASPNIVQVSQTPTGTTYARSREIQVEYSLSGVTFNNSNSGMFIKSSVLASIVDHDQEAFTTYEYIETETGNEQTQNEITGYRNREFLVASCGTGNTPGTCSEISESEIIEPNVWYKLSEDVDETINLLYTRDGTIYAITKGDSNQSLMSTYNVTNIDIEPPVVTISGQQNNVVVKIIDNIGLSSYRINSNTLVQTSGKTISVPITANPSNNYVYAYDLAGNSTYYSFDVEEAKWEYGYVGYTESFTAPYTGTYQLEVWGAEGTAPTYQYTVGEPGKGGYSTGEVYLNAGDTLYISVGGNEPYITYNSQSNISTVNLRYSYNGGAIGGKGMGNGGGATSIATTNRAELRDYVNNKSEVLIVAGGGGGSGYDPPHGTNECKGGSGGGVVGVSGTSSYGNKGPDHRAGAGGSQVSAGENGSGGTAGGFGYAGRRSSSWGAGGGGGWYGGGAGYNNTDSENDLLDAEGAGGGSGYIGNSLLSNKVMYCYNCTASNADDTKTISTTNYSSLPVSNHAKAGTGFARITYKASEQNTTTFNYTGGTQEFTVPQTGTYKLEVWGASSGNLSVTGKGGYATATVELQQGYKLYITVGGTNGYNGGAEGLVDNVPCSYDLSISNGGGATHIATSNYGELVNYANRLNDILIVGSGAGGTITYTEYNKSCSSIGSSMTTSETYQASETFGVGVYPGGGGGYYGGDSNYSDKYHDEDIEGIEVYSGTIYIKSLLSDRNYQFNQNLGNGKAKITLLE